MLKKLLFGFFAMALPVFSLLAQETARASVSANPNARPATARAPTISLPGGITSISAIVSSGSTTSATTTLLDTATCVRRYLSCLNADDVCGGDFELCTDNTSFRMQKIFCQATLDQCGNTAKTDLFGSTVTTNDPTATSRLGTMITEAAALAGVNAVNTCYKVANNCMLSACSKNPYLCKEGTTTQLVCSAGFVNDPLDPLAGCSDPTGVISTEQINASAIRKFISSKCSEIIGGNKYCYATSSLGNGIMPTAAQLADPANKQTVFADIYSTQMNDNLKAMIDDQVADFDQTTKNKCQTTVVNCAMQNCGDGSGLACYNLATTGSTPAAPVVDILLARAGIAAGCTATVDNDASCKYSSAAFDAATGAITPSASAFDVVFPAAVTALTPDVVNAVSALNLRLQKSFNVNAMQNMTKQCQNVAKQCVADQCGADYSGCYRNRGDILSGISTGPITGMNKVNGILDRTIIVGLCKQTVQNDATCKEVLDAAVYAQAATSAVSAGGAVWGAALPANVGQGWLGVGATAVTGTAATGFTVDLAADQIFQVAINDLEIEAQAKYNVKKTREMTACLNSNQGGVITADSVNGGSTFNWVKLVSGRQIPANYSVAGLQTSDMESGASNDLYGSFCRVRVTLQSDEKYIQDTINAGPTWAAAYFATGDPFTCGSWIPQSTLTSIAKSYAESKTGTDDSGALSKGQKWLAAGVTVIGAAGGGYLGNVIGGKIAGKNENQVTDEEAGNARAELAAFQAKVKGMKVQMAKDAGITAKESEFNSAKTEKGVAKERIRGLEEELDQLVATSMCVQGTENTRLKAFAGAYDESVLYNYNCTPGAKPGSDESTVSYAATIKMLEKYEKYKAKDVKSGEKANKATKNWMTAIGAVGGAAIGGVASWQIMKAANVKKFTDAEAEWMAQFGEHIRCYVGNTMAGVYGDTISIGTN